MLTFYNNLCKVELFLIILKLYYLCTRFSTDKNIFMEAHFSRISCWIFNRPVPPMPIDTIVYYESSWDLRTNDFIKQNQKKINDALSTYPSGYCRFQLFYVPQPQTQYFANEEEKQAELNRKAALYKNATSPFEGMLSCALKQDKGHEEYTSQRIMTFNIEDCTEQTILTAIRYMAKLADDFKDEVMEGSGAIPAQYRQMWQVDLAIECKELYDSVSSWLSGDYEMYFTQPILKFDEETHRLWFVDNKGNLKEQFVKNDLLTQAFYILVWNHPEGIKDSDLCCDPTNKEAVIREKELKEEFVQYYQIFNTKHAAPIMKIEEFCSANSSNDRSIARNRIKNAFLNHETNRVHELFAQKLTSYYSFDGKEGIIRAENIDPINNPNYNRTTIILPDKLKLNILKHNADN